MFGLNRKKKQAAVTAAVTAPVRGALVALDQVPDPVFSGGVLGPGFAVDPADGTVRAPIAGTVVTVPETRHAVGLRSEGGIELLIHIGIDTMTTKGEGFTARCAAGETVEAGQVLVEVDLDLLRDRVPSLLTPVIVTNSTEWAVSGPDLSAGFGAPGLTLTAP